MASIFSKSFWTPTQEAGSGKSFWGPGKTANRMIGNLGKDITGATAAEKAAEAQRTGLAEAGAAQERMFDKSLETQQPWLEAGERALGSLESGIQSGQFGTDAGQFDFADYDPGAGYEAPQFDFEADPGYKFRLEQGMKAIEGSAAARGGLFSGGTGQALQEFGQGLAAQEYGDAYRRFQDQRNFDRGIFESDRGFGRGEFESDRGFGYGQFMDDYNRERAGKTDEYNRLASLAGVGQMTAGNVSRQQMAQGGNLANLALQSGNIGAERAMAGYEGGMNLLNTGLQGAALAQGIFGGKKKG